VDTARKRLKDIYPIHCLKMRKSGVKMYVKKYKKIVVKVNVKKLL